MSYTLLLKDGKTHKFDDVDGYDLKQHWIEATKPFPIDLGEVGAYSSVDIKRITKDPEFKQPAFISDVNKQAGMPGCNSTRPIQRELIKIASKQKNPKLLADKQWREEQLTILRDSGEKWCDWDTGECACL